MARPKKTDISFMSLGLEPAQDKQLIRLLKDKDISGKQLLRFLVKGWLKEQQQIAGVKTTLKK